MLESALTGPLRRAALYGLALRVDPASLPAVEAAVGVLGGLDHLLVYERTMRDVVRAAAGRPVDLGNLRLALRTVMDNKYADAELHRTAIALVAATLTGTRRRARCGRSSTPRTPRCGRRR